MQCWIWLISQRGQILNQILATGQNIVVIQSICHYLPIYLLYLFIITLDHALRRALDGREEKLGLMVTPRKSRQVGPTVKTDFNFTDDIALVSNLEDQAKELLHRVEGACRDVGLRLNAKKTEVMTFNTDQVEFKTLDASRVLNSTWLNTCCNWGLQVPGILHWVYRKGHHSLKSPGIASTTLPEKDVEILCKLRAKVESILCYSGGYTTIWLRDMDSD